MVQFLDISVLFDFIRITTSEVLIGHTLTRNNSVHSHLYSPLCKLKYGLHYHIFTDIFPRKHDLMTLKPIVGNDKWYGFSFDTPKIPQIPQIPQTSQASKHALETILKIKIKIKTSFDTPHSLGVSSQS